MTRGKYVFAAAATGTALVLSACGGSSDSGPTKTETETVTASATAEATTQNPATAPATTSAPQTTGAASGADLQSLIPTPANTSRTEGPDSINENGSHTYFEVAGAPQSVMDAYKAALEAKGWSLSVENSGGGGHGGGATFAGTNNGAYGVFTGGGYRDTTDIDACVWPSKPSHTHCDDD